MVDCFKPNTFNLVAKEEEEENKEKVVVALAKESKEKRLGGLSYFAGAKKKDKRVLVPDLGSLTSIHDRARELFYYLKGGQVDYGEEHSKIYGHSQFGKTYGQEWDEHPIHFVGHSAGMQVVRVLQQMLADKLSWTFEKQGTKMEWRWKCQPSSDNRQTTSEILDFLMDANIHLSEEVVRKTQSVEKLKAEAERCLLQSEKFNNEKAIFESAVYSKFVAVLNSKKAKLRELRDRILKLEAIGKAPKEEDDSTDKTETFDEDSDNESIKEEPVEEIGDDIPFTSENIATSSKGRKRTRK